MRLIKKFSIILIIITLSLAFLSACKSKKVDELEREVEELKEKLEKEESSGQKITEESITEKKEAEPQKGQVVTKDKVEICIPPQTQDIKPEITIKEANENIAPPPKDSKQVIEAYQITTDSGVQGPMLLTLSYDPDSLPEGTNEENLYIATLIDDSWEAIEGGLIDTEKNTISVSVEHFSFFGILESAKDAVYDVVEAIQNYTEDISRQSYSNLPQGIKDDLSDIVTQDIKSVVKLELSHLTKFSSAIIDFAGLVSETSELALDLVDGTKQAIVKGASLTLASLASQYADSELAGFSLMLYSSADTGKDIGKYLGGADLDPYTIAAEAAAWVLAMEMQYINDNMDKAFTDLYKYNILSLSWLKMYAVFIDSGPVADAAKPRMKGIKFYYYDEGKDKWVNYYNDIVTWEIKAERSEEGSKDQVTEEEPKEEIKIVKEETEEEVEEFVVNVPTTITITPNSSPTLEDAIENLVSGSTIILESGNYNISKSITVNKELTISGSGKDSTEILIDNGPIIIKNAGTFTIENLTFVQDNDHCDVIRAENCEANIYDCRFEDSLTAVTFIGSSTGTINNCEFINGGSEVSAKDNSTPTIEGSYFEESSKGVIFEGNATGMVKDCEFIDAGYGVSAKDNSTPTIEGNIFKENSNAIAIYGDAEVLLEYNECTDGSDGYGPIVFNDKSKGIVRFNKCINNQHMDGIDINDYSVVTLEENECSNNSNGIDVGNDADATIINNICNNNEVDGIVLIGRSTGIASYNECNGNEADGIYVSDSASFLIEYNKCSNNGDGGIYYRSNGPGEINNNECVNNEDGIVIGDNAETVYFSDNYCSGNEYEDFIDYR